MITPAWAFGSRLWAFGPQLLALGSLQGRVLPLPIVRCWSTFWNYCGRWASHLGGLADVENKPVFAAVNRCHPKSPITPTFSAASKLVPFPDHFRATFSATADAVDENAALTAAVEEWARELGPFDFAQAVPPGLESFFAPYPALKRGLSWFAPPGLGGRRKRDLRMGTLQLFGRPLVFPTPAANPHSFKGLH